MNRIINIGEQWTTTSGLAVECGGHGNNLQPLFYSPGLGRRIYKDEYGSLDKPINYLDAQSKWQSFHQPCRCHFCT